MKLYFNPFSPFARKVILASHFLGLEKDIELVKISTADLPKDYHKINPLLKIPSFVTDTNENIIDSYFICEYLNSIAKKGNLFPTDSKQNREVKYSHVVSSNATESAVAMRMESLKPSHLHDPAHFAKHRKKILNSLDYFNQNFGFATNQVFVDSLSLVTFLGYLKFRFSKETWFAENQKLFGWHDEMQKQYKIIADTTPKE